LKIRYLIFKLQNNRISAMFQAIATKLGSTTLGPTLNPKGSLH